MADNTTRASPKRRFWTREARLAYLLLTPAILLLAAFMIYPLGYVSAMSAYRTNGLGGLIHFSGLTNYINVFADSAFWRITVRSIIWTVLGVLWKATLGMTIALLLNVKFPGHTFARMLFIPPWAASVPISVILWSWVYTPQFGLLNYTLQALHLWANPPVWLGSTLPAFVAQLWVDVWLGVPFSAIIYLAGMQSIPDDLYESAYMDGVNPVQKFLYITLPGLRNIILIVTLLSALSTFNDFNTIYILTRGGPFDSTDILVTSIYKNAFEWQHFSAASVMAVVTFVILMAISIVYARYYFKGDEAR